MPSVIIFANPISGRGRAAKIAERLNRRLMAEGYEVRVFLERADRLHRRDLPLDAVAAIVIGGDGTLRAIAERMFDLGQLSGGESLTPPMLIVPMGTANLMGKHLGIAWDDRRLDEQVLHVLRTGRIVRLDIARANDGLLLLVAGIGLDGQVVHELTRRRVGPISHLSYAMPMLSAIGSYDYLPLGVTVDDQLIFGPAPAMVFVGNVAEYGTGFPILPRASPTDGQLDVCVLPCRSREELFGHLLRAAAGEHLQGEEVVYRQGRRIHIDGPRPVPVQIDGEAAGHTPLAIDLLPVRLPFIVPGK